MSAKVIQRGPWKIVGALLAAVALVGLAFAGKDRLFGGARPAVTSHGEPASSNPPPRPLPPAGPAELALIAPLAVGDVEGTWKLKEVSAVDEGLIHLIFVPEKGRSKIEILVARASDDGPTPPMVVGRYALFYSVKRVMETEGDALCRAVAKRLEKNKDIPPPAGLLPYHPVDKREDPL